MKEMRRYIEIGGKKKPRQGWAEAAERLAKEAKEDISKRKAGKGGIVLV